MKSTNAGLGSLAAFAAFSAPTSAKLGLPTLRYKTMRGTSTTSGASLRTGAIMSLRHIAAVLVGILGAAFAHFIAILLSGPGEGWTEPFLFSLFLWVMFPAVAIRRRLRRQQGGRRSAIDVGMLAVAVILDLALVLATVHSGKEYFDKAVDFAGLLVIVWIGFWLSWQVIVAWWVLDSYVLDGDGATR